MLNLMGLGYCSWKKYSSRLLSEDESNVLRQHNHKIKGHTCIGRYDTVNKQNKYCHMN